MDNEQILKQAKGIMDRFIAALDKSGVKEKEVFVSRDEMERKEGEGLMGDKDFRKIMFENAPEVEGDCIKAEKGAWT
jgi:hypothetical protein